MSARQRIENLTTSWVIFFVVVSLVMLFFSGFGFFSVLTAVGSAVIDVMLALYLGRKLMAGSSLTRTFLLVVATLGAVLGGIAAAKLGWALLHGFSGRLLLLTALVGADCAMAVHSLRVLLHPSVKAHCS